MALSSPRNPVRRPLAVLAAVLAGVAIVAVGCGDDSADSSSSTTASSTTVSTAPTSTSSTTSSGAEVGDGRIQVTIGGEQRTLTIEACTSGDSSSMELTARDDSGNQMTVKVAGGQGSVTYRGSSEDREGAIRSVDIQADGTFDLGGILSVADDSAPGPDDLTVTGLCPA
ncbi:MAG TPA: hypothetical protein P5193_11595 [Microthrixaceae bacterium]|nr:hypothetical protein [Microthrixaceae bacterium]MCB9401377.1 hypothetical protein [Microthrixaceae bacterium]MCO5305934.1 hypothetical protein [Microthrixaceae bacterium]HPG15910.1 hypothetical protein [Microthrixaceae bacterium]HRW42182.1 hypothetical protein [Microthrixaceae bacterium]